MPTIDFIAGEEHEVTTVLAYRLWETRGCPLVRLRWIGSRRRISWPRRSRKLRP